MLIWNLILRFYCPPPFLLLLSVPSDERQLNHWAEKDSCTLCIPKLTSATHSPSCVVATMHSYTHHCDPGALLHSVTVALLYFTFLYYSCTYISNATPDFDKLTAQLCQWSTPYVPVQLPHYRCCSFIHSFQELIWYALMSTICVLSFQGSWRRSSIVFVAHIQLLLLDRFTEKRRWKIKLCWIFLLPRINRDHWNSEQNARGDWQAE